MKESLWSGKPWQAFKNFAIIFSFVVNLILIVVLLAAVPLILPIVNNIAVPIVGGLNQSFVDMGQARIVRIIEVNDNIPIRFDVPLTTATTVQLLEPVPLQAPTTFVLPGGGGFINGTVSLDLPAGIDLPVQLDLIVPVSQTIPVNLAVAVDIPMAETELGQPFQNLQAIFGPLDLFLRALPDDASDLFDRIFNSTPAAEPVVKEGLASGP
jgi:hypothetical protein